MDREEFEFPWAKYRAKPFWSLNGKLEKKELEKQIEIFKEMGFGGAFLHSRTGLATEYMSEEWMDRIGDCIKKLTELGMEAWLYDEDRWPSGTCGGIVAKDPRYRLKSMVAQVLDGAAEDFKTELPVLGIFDCVFDGENSIRSFSRYQKGAPYWVARTILRFKGQTLNDVVEYTRMQEKWCENSGIEVFHECDTYPRPRYYIPANLCEAFDVALRASGNMGGLKYLFCYDTTPNRENGYVKRHIRNMPLYDFIEKHFEGKKTLGVQVYEEMHKFVNMMLKKSAPANYVEEKAIIETTFSPAAHLLTSHSIPTAYDENQDVAIVFGKNAKYIKNFPKR